jgi:hypothetical protein
MGLQGRKDQLQQGEESKIKEPGRWTNRDAVMKLSPGLTRFAATLGPELHKRLEPQRGYDTFV